METTQQTTHKTFNGGETSFEGSHLFRVRMSIEGAEYGDETIAADREGQATTRIMLVIPSFPSGKLVEYDVETVA